MRPKLCTFPTVEGGGDGGGHFSVKPPFFGLEGEILTFAFTILQLKTFWWSVFIWNFRYFLKKKIKTT